MKIHFTSSKSFTFKTELLYPCLISRKLALKNKSFPIFQHKNYLCEDKSKYSAFINE